MAPGSHAQLAYKLAAQRGLAPLQLRRPARGPPLSCLRRRRAAVRAGVALELRDLLFGRNGSGRGPDADGPINFSFKVRGLRTTTSALAPRVRPHPRNECGCWSAFQRLSRGTL
eukprot:gene17182-biopygen20349